MNPESRNLGFLRFLAPSFLAVLAAFACSSAIAGTLTGTVRNGTTGRPAAGVDVILIQLQGGMQPVANTKTDAQGRFQFDNPGVGTAPMLIRAQYRGVNYHEPLPPGKTTAEMEVFEPTDKPGSFSVSAHAVIVQTNGPELIVGEEFSIENKTKPPVAYYRADGSFLFVLPDGAQLNEVSAAGSAGMPVVQGTIDKGKNVSAIAFPFRPGESEVRVSYKLPYPGEHATLRFVSPYPAERFAVFAPPSVQVSGDKLSPAGSDQGFSVYLRDSVPGNSPINVSLTGSAPMVAANQGGGAVGAPPGTGEASQNPSVNSRLEASGAETPTTSATTIPARLDSLKWILVIGFAAIFALGFIYVWRRPQVVTAAASPNITSPAAAPGARARPKSSPALADVEREVRVSLDELKEKLFRLELRRQAGTINERDYADERQRMEKVLRELVRG
jgi:hypothetical protein